MVGLETRGRRFFPVETQVTSIQDGFPDSTESGYFTMRALFARLSHRAVKQQIPFNQLPPNLPPALRGDRIFPRTTSTFVPESRNLAAIKVLLRRSRRSIGPTRAIIAHPGHRSKLAHLLYRITLELSLWLLALLPLRGIHACLLYTSPSPRDS